MRPREHKVETLKTRVFSPLPIWYRARMIHNLQHSSTDFWSYRSLRSQKIVKKCDESCSHTKRHLSVTDKQNIINLGALGAPTLKPKYFFSVVASRGRRSSRVSNVFIACELCLLFNHCRQHQNKDEKANGSRRSIFIWNSFFWRRVKFGMKSCGPSFQPADLKFRGDVKLPYKSLFWFWSEWPWSTHQRHPESFEETTSDVLRFAREMMRKTTEIALLQLSTSDRVASVF